MLRQFLCVSALLLIATPIAFGQPAGAGAGGAGASSEGAAPPSFGAGGSGAGGEGAAAATPPAPPTPPAPKATDENQIDDARTRMERGQRLFADGKFTEATDEFASAFEKHKFTAFLFNAAVAAERGGHRERAIEIYEKFLRSEPNAPDKAEIEKTVDRLKKENASPPPEVTASSQKAEIKSLILIESDPPGAPVSIYLKTDPKAGLLDPKQPNAAGYKKVVTGLTSPTNLSLNFGTYFIVVEGFRDYNANGSQFTFEPGRVYVYRAGLSQGDFVGRVEVNVPVSGAQIYVDDPPPHKNAPRATGTNSIELSPGKHDFWIEAPGFEVFQTRVEITQGKIVKLDAVLERLKYGYLLVSGNADVVEVEVDGEDIGVYKKKSGERLRIRVPAGQHDIEIDADGRKAFDSVVSIPRGQEITVDAKLEDAPGKGGAIATTVLAALSLGGGIVLNRYVAGLPEGADLKAPLNGVSIGCFAGAGAFTGLSIFLFLFDPGDDSNAKISIPREFTGETDTPVVKEKSVSQGALPRSVTAARMLEIGVLMSPSEMVPFAAALAPALPAGLFVKGSF